MKLSLIAVCMLVIAGCASGEGDPVEEPVAVEVPKPQIPAPTPPPVAEEEDAAPPIKCHIESYEDANCIVVKIYCEGKPVQIEISCHGPPLWPWEYIPDPPYDSNVREVSHAERRRSY